MRWKTGDKTYGLQKPTQHFVSQNRFVITIPFSTAPAGLSRLERLVLLACLLVSSNQNQRNHSNLPVTSGLDNPVNQSELVAKHVTGAKGGKYLWRDHGTFGVTFIVPDLVKKWREIQL